MYLQKYENQSMNNHFNILKGVIIKVPSHNCVLITNISVLLCYFRTDAGNRKFKS